MEPVGVASGDGLDDAEIPDQSGRVAVVTGANGGLGLQVARELARKGGHVVMAARDQAKAEAAQASIRRGPAVRG